MLPLPRIYLIIMPKMLKKKKCKKKPKADTERRKEKMIVIYVLYANIGLLNNLLIHDAPLQIIISSGIH